MVFFAQTSVLKKIKAKKRLGQHFLKDEGIVDQIIASIDNYCDKDIPLIEVGPGTGVLTKRLIEIYPDLRVIEFDRDMLVIQKTFLKEDQIIAGDFLKIDLSKLGFSQCNVVGNFPYNISSQIIFKVLEERVEIPVVIGMFQKEMALRICAGPGTKANGGITIKAQAFYDAELLFDIPPESFSPPPKVNSSMILLQRNNRDELPCDPSLFKQVVNAGFSQRRKKLRNTLKQFDIEADNEIYQKRAEHLSVEDFINITIDIEKSKKA